MTKKNSLVLLSVLLLCITAFFYDIIYNGYVLVIISVIPIANKLIACVGKNKGISAGWLLFIVFSISSLFFSNSLTESIKFICFFIICFLIKHTFECEMGWEKRFYKLMFICSAVHVVATLLSVLAPELIINIVSKRYSGEAFEVYSKLFLNESYAGIASHTGINGFFISIFLGITVCKIAESPKKLSNYLFLILAVIAIFLTKKRSFIIANLCATVIVFFKILVHSKNKIMKILVFAVLILVVYNVLLNSEAGQGVLEKNDSYENLEDVSNGRFDLWEKTFGVFKENPILGVGIGSLTDSYELSSHNTYFQLLAEVGILGFMSYILLLLGDFKKTLKTISGLTKAETGVSEGIKYCSVALYIQIIFIVYSFFGNPLSGISIFLIYTLCSALVSLEYNKLKEFADENRDINIS